MNPRFLLLLILVLILAAASAFRQTAAGTLTGIVTDPSGAVISNVPVTATHVDTGTKVIGVTSQTGNYTIPQMPVGRYVVTVVQTGFKTFREENVIIDAAQTLRLDVSLEVGATSESVTVTAESTLLQADTGALVKNINPQQIQNLPVLPATTFIRDPLQLAQTLPGAVQGGPIAGYSPRMNGLSDANNQLKIDGEPVTNSGEKGTISTRNNVSPDAVQEVAIQSSNFNAEYGSASGVLINLIIKSGTNQYHGTASTISATISSMPMTPARIPGTGNGVTIMDSTLAVRSGSPNSITARTRPSSSSTGNSIAITTIFWRRSIRSQPSPRRLTVTATSPAYSRCRGLPAT